MKKVVIFIFLASLFLSVSGQEKSFYFGFKASPGINWYKPHSKGLTSEGAGFDISAGLIADIRLAGNYFFETGFFYNYQNGNLKYVKSYKSVPTEVLREYNVQYLEIPLSVKMCTNYFGMVRFWGLGGFKSSFRLAATADDTWNELSAPKLIEKEDAASDFAFFKESLLLGLGADIQVDKSISLTFGINCNISLTNVAGKDMKCYYEDEQIKAKFSNNILEFRLGVIF